MRLEAGDWAAEFMPERGLLGLSVTYRGPIHGTMIAQPGWEVVREEPAGFTARFAYDRDDLLGAFPFPHGLEVEVVLDDGLRLERAILARERAVPVSFGWHPYFRADRSSDRSGCSSGGGSTWTPAVFQRAASGCCLPRVVTSATASRTTTTRPVPTGASRSVPSSSSSGTATRSRRCSRRRNPRSWRSSR